MSPRHPKGVEQGKLKTETLVKQFQKGQTLAAQLYQLHAKATYNSLLRLGLRVEEAQDLLQESFIRGFNRIDELEEAAAFGAWLKRIAINLGLQEIRKQKRSVELLKLDKLEIESEEIDTDWPEIGFDALKAALKSLPEGCQLIFELYYLEDYSHQEIASELQVSVSTSKSQLHYAKRLLREKLKPQYEA